MKGSPIADAMAMSAAEFAAAVADIVRRVRREQLASIDRQHLANLGIATGTTANTAKAQQRPPKGFDAMEMSADEWRTYLKSMP